jgi:hemin uptake protein HemP
MTKERGHPRLDDVPFSSMSGTGALSAPATAREDRLAIDVRTLLNGAREATLILDGEAYKLRITAKEKLILTK